MRTTGDYIELASWRRSVAEMYTAVRLAATTAVDPSVAWQQFVAARNVLFKTHLQSPLGPEQRAAFAGLNYYAYDPRLRLVGRLDRHISCEMFCLELPAEGLFRYTRVAAIHFTLGDTDVTLNLYWVEGYGGGLFLPFRDSTNGQETFGGGRYLYDTIKGADLGISADEIMLDFNYAYNPSCAYSAHWVCPLAPGENRLALPVPAGEKQFRLGLERAGV